ncbi:MAG: hypothetical protein ABJN36_16800 [Cyclobacteriaceae bacterium]
MKNSILLTLATIIAFSAFSATSDSVESVKEKINIVSNKPNSFKLLANPIDAGSLVVRITDQNNVLVHRTTINPKKGFMKKFDLEELESGSYTVTVKLKKDLILNKEVEVKKEQFDLLPIGNGKYQISLNNTNSEKYELSIIDQKDQIVGQDQIEIAGDFSKVYDLSELKSESFVFQLTSMTSGLSQKRSIK